MVGSEERVAKWKAEIETLKAEMAGLQEQYPKLVASLEKYWTYAPPRPKGPAAAGPAPTEPARPFAHIHRTVYERRVRRRSIYRRHGTRNTRLLTTRPTKRGISRCFCTVMSRLRGRWCRGTSSRFLRREMERSRTAPGAWNLLRRSLPMPLRLSARVIVNRVWDWHFGHAIVSTPSDFGVQGDKPSDSGLLDDLAARFIAHGWSLKWLNKEIMLSAAYRQSSKPRADGEKVDQLNTLLWRMNPRRMDVESYRDTLLRAAGRLDEKMYGLSEEVDSPTNLRRTVYGRVSRGRMSTLLKLYDFSRSHADERRPGPDNHFPATALRDEQRLHARRRRDVWRRVWKISRTIPRK